jgi:o-succinylbenzoate---CoA ligase
MTAAPGGPGPASDAPSDAPPRVAPSDAPRLVALTDDPHHLTELLERTWAAGDAAVVQPDATVPAPPIAAALDREPPVPTLPRGTALVVATSGSSGTPRAVLLSHAQLAASTAASLARLDCAPGERWALALPVRHVAGLQVLARARALGTEPVVVERPGDAHAIAAASSDAQHVALVPTQLVRCLDAGADLTGFRSVLVGGGPLAPERAAQARDAGIRLVQSYGMTETCGGCVYDGLPLDGVEVAVDDAGRIALRGPMRATGYLRRPGTDDVSEADAARFTDDGWFVTDDVGALERGVLRVDGRADDVIVTGGVKVPPALVEAALRTHPGVADVVVVGVSDDEWGERVRAVLVASDPSRPPTLSELQDHADVRALPSGHVPRELRIVAAIARDGLGKLSADERARLRGD